ncbi:MAG: 1-acyl-sn-glycerol-3-phosphate acyltransferase [Bacteroidales bacterium]|nr:1-acyl-sn-glycerol-3-phosphate acyltransferase [Bacteroidales bacterium]MDD4670243.1 1-acyl-sn-glycerol-3-phosphate acyltransferase [Bacteroidales bacterium]
MELISVQDFEKVSSVFQGKVGNSFARFLLRQFAIDKINQLYENNEQYSGGVFAEHVLQDLGVNYKIGYAERLQNLPEGAFITISNHPYGSIDGVILVDLFSKICTNYKVIVNKFLSRIEAMSSSFICVNPNGNEKAAATRDSIIGIKQTLEHISAGYPIGLFPSGAVSDLSLKEMRIRDRAWQEGIIKVIHKANVPILPVRFFDRNSHFYYNLGMIDWKVRILRLPREVFNKAGKNVRIGVGKLISPDDINMSKGIESVTEFLRNSVYNMPIPEKFLLRSDL